MKPDHATIKMNATAKLFILLFKVLLTFKKFRGSAKTLKYDFQIKST